MFGKLTYSTSVVTHGKVYCHLSGWHQYTFDKLRLRQPEMMSGLKQTEARENEASTLKVMTRHFNEFSERVKNVRRYVALSHEELTYALGVSFATVNRWENGKTIRSKLAQRQIEQFCKDNVMNGNPAMDEVNK